MKTFIYAVVGCLLGLALSACSQQVMMSKTQSASKTCQQQCSFAANQCKASCRNSCAQCSLYANNAAKMSYRHYQREQVITGGTIARQLQSYRDPLQCRKTTCNCQADHQLCLQSCGGVIHKQLRAAPVC